MTTGRPPQARHDAGEEPGRVPSVSGAPASRAVNASVDWQPPTKLECLRCGGWFITRELNPRCPYCGHRETPDD
jgi:rubrerythrin